MKTFRKIAILFLLINLMNFGASNIEGKIYQIRKEFASTNAMKNYVIKEVEDPEQSTDGGMIRYIGENKKVVENGQKLKEIEKDILKEYYRIKN